MVLTPIRIFEGSFGGATVFENPGEFARFLRISLCSLNLDVELTMKEAGGQLNEQHIY